MGPIVAPSVSCMDTDLSRQWCLALLSLVDSNPSSQHTVRTILQHFAFVSNLPSIHAALRAMERMQRQGQEEFVRDKGCDTMTFELLGYLLATRGQTNRPFVHNLLRDMELLHWLHVATTFQKNTDGDGRSRICQEEAAACMCLLAQQYPFFACSIDNPFN